MKYLVSFLSIILITSCSFPERDWRHESTQSHFLHRTIKKITDVIVHDIFSPPTSSRIYAYVTIAAYEAAIPGDPSFKSLAYQLKDLQKIPEPDAGKEYVYALASVRAALQVGKKLTFSEEMLEDFQRDILREIRKTGIPHDVFERSIAYGDAVANHILAWSDGDNYKQSRSFPKYSIASDPALWKPTPPGYMDAIEPHWNRIRALVLDSAAQFKPQSPTPFSVDPRSKFYEEVLETYRYGINPTEEEREIAFFWDCNPFMLNVKGHVMFATKKISPNGHWVNITRVASEMKQLNYIHAVEAYVSVCIAMFDAIISCWDEKYRSQVIRPETFINQYINESWTPLLQTPPFPEYTSGHSVISSSAQVLLTSIFGENFSFVDSTEVEFGLPVRSFTSFKHASEEAATSRLYGGIHYRPAIEQGVTQGIGVGNLVKARVKTRKDEQPLALQ